MVDEYVNVTGFDAVVSQKQTAPGAGANAVTSSSLTTNFNGDLIYGVTFNMNGNAEMINAGSGFAVRQQSAGFGEATEDRVVGNAPQVGAATFTASLGASNYYLTFAVALVR